MFRVDENTHFIIYGASYIGSVTGKALQKQGVSILCFVDQRADEIKECLGVAVRKPEELEILDYKEAVVFVAVKNVYYHEEIVQRLNSMGYEKIIYKTHNSISGIMNDNEKILDMVYENINKKGLLSNSEIPIILSEKQVELPEVAVIREEYDEYIVRMPVELVYTGKTDKQWTDVPVLAAIPYLQLFRYFEGIPGCTPDGYIELCQKGAQNEDLKITDGWKAYVVSNRYFIYEQMRWRLEFEPNYFIENAPRVVFNQKGYFNLQTGKHRICFLVALGYGTVAVRVNKKEWNEFFCNEERKQLEKNINRNREKKQPVTHPFFMGNLDFSTRKIRKKLMNILLDWYNQGIVQGNYRTIERVAIDVEEEPYYTDFFNKMGIQVDYRG